MRKLDVNSLGLNLNGFTPLVDRSELSLAVFCRRGKHRSVAAAVVLEHVLRHAGFQTTGPFHLSSRTRRRNGFWIQNSSRFIAISLQFHSISSGFRKSFTVFHSRGIGANAMKAAPNVWKATRSSRNIWPRLCAAGKKRRNSNDFTFKVFKLKLKLSDITLHNLTSYVFDDIS